MNDTAHSQPVSDPTQLSYWVYISEANHPWGEAELSILLQKSRDNNACLGLTGLLLYKDGNFIQMLEGPRTAVQEMTEKIRRDERHGGVVSLIHANQTQRLFPGEWMGFVASDAISEEQHARMDALLKRAKVAPEDMDVLTGTHPARTLMQIFAHHM